MSQVDAARMMAAAIHSTADRLGGATQPRCAAVASRAMAKNGMAVSDASPEMKAALAKIGEQMAVEWETSAGADGQAILKAYRGK